MQSTSYNDSPLSAGFIGLLILFLIFFFPWCWHTFKSARAVLTYEKTTGTIQHESYVPPNLNASSPSAHPSSKIGTYTHSAVFRTTTGETHQVFTRVRSNPPPFEIGDKVKIYYDRHNPSHAIIGTFFELWLPPIALGFFSFIFFILWLGVWIGPPASQ